MTKSAPKPTYHRYSSSCSSYSRRRCCIVPTTIDKYIIVFKDDVNIDNKVKELEKKSGFKHKHKFDKALHGCAVTMDKSLINELLDDPNIKYIEKDTIISSSMFDKTTLGLEQVTMPLWHQSITNTALIDTDNYSMIHSYILDTGILATHSEFYPAQVLLDYNAITKTFGADAQDNNGHGTAVASMIGGKTVGTANKTTLHSIKVLDSTGSGYVSDIISGLNWVITNKKPGPTIINMSLGGSSSTSFNTAIQSCLINNIVVVVAAGNSGVDASTSSPANTVGAITVAAYDNLKTRPTWSNYGPVIGTFAPGASIKAAWGDDISSYYLVSGTSFSAPLTTGIISRYLKLVPNATQAQVITFLNKSNVINEIINPGTSTPNLRIVWNPSNATDC